VYKKILVPLDGSPLSEAVLPHVRSLTEQGVHEVVLLRVPDYPIYDATLIDPAMVQMLYDQVRGDTNTYLAARAKELETADCKVVTLLGEGAVADCIIDCAARRGVDLIAMSTHGRGGISRWLLGSVADRVLQGAQTPVLLVRPAPAGGKQHT